MDEQMRAKLEFATYAAEEPVGFSLVDAGQEADWDTAVYVPLPLVARLVSVAAGYQLHHLPMIDLYGDVRFTRVQRQNLIDELDFIADVIRDSALAEAIRMIRPLVENQTPLELLVSGP